MVCTNQKPIRDKQKIRRNLNKESYHIKNEETREENKNGKELGKKKTETFNQMAVSIPINNYFKCK